VEDIRKALTGSGSATITQGKLVNWDMLNQLGEFLKMKELKNQDVKTLKNSFKIDNQRLYFDDFFATTTDADWEVKGSVGFDASLDYSITIYLSPSLSQRFNLMGDLSDFFKDEKGRLIIDLKVSGPSSSPKFTLDTSRAEKSFQQKLKIKDEKLKEELKKKGEDILKKIIKK
jgi:autotransporter translocation and assembly factor TamB